MKNLEYDKALLLLIMLRVQHLNESVCDVLPCDYTCTFAETEFYIDGDMISLELKETSIVVYTVDGLFHIHIQRTLGFGGRTISFTEMMKHISFEDKV